VIGGNAAHSGRRPDGGVEHRIVGGLWGHDAGGGVTWGYTARATPGAEELVMDLDLARDGGGRLLAPVLASRLRVPGGGDGLESREVHVRIAGWGPAGERRFGVRVARLPSEVGASLFFLGYTIAATGGGPVVAWTDLFDPQDVARPSVDHFQSAARLSGWTANPEPTRIVDSE